MIQRSAAFDSFHLEGDTTAEMQCTHVILVLCGHGNPALQKSASGINEPATSPPSA